MLSLMRNVIPKQDGSGITLYSNLFIIITAKKQLNWADVSVHFWCDCQHYKLAELVLCHRAKSVISCLG